MRLSMGPRTAAIQGADGNSFMALPVHIDTEGTSTYDVSQWRAPLLTSCNWCSWEVPPFEWGSVAPN